MLLSSATWVDAEIITFEADAEIMIVRGRQTLDFAIYEVLGSRDGEIRCIALNNSGDPMAVTTGYVEMGAVMFHELDVADVDRVACRYQ